MAVINEHIIRVNNKLQQLLKQYLLLQRENEKLKELLKDLQTNRELEAEELSRLHQQVGILKTSVGQMTDLIPINIVIGDRTYRIKTLAKDEEVIRRTLKIINDKIIEFKTQFGGKDMQDYIAMVMIWYATQATADSNPALEKEVADALLKMELALDKAL